MRHTLKIFTDTQTYTDTRTDRRCLPLAYTPTAARPSTVSSSPSLVALIDEQLKVQSDDGVQETEDKRVRGHRCRGSGTGGGT